MINLACVECGAALEVHANACSCGWRKQVAVQAKLHVDHRCAYQHNGQTCNAFGTIARSCKGNSPWYCSLHWDKY